MVSCWLDFGMTRPTDRTDRDAGPAAAGLFDDLPEPSEAQMERAQAKAAERLRQSNRMQVELRASDLGSLLATSFPPALGVPT